MTDITLTAQQIAKDYVNFLLSDNAEESLRKLIGDSVLPAAQQQALADDDFLTYLYKSEKRANLLPVYPPLATLAKRLHEEFTNLFKSELADNPTSHPIAGADLTYRKLWVNPNRAEKVFANCDAAIKKSGISETSLSIKATSAPAYTICSSGAIVCYNMGDCSVLPESTAQLQPATLAVLTEKSFTVVHSPEILYAARKILEKPITVGQQLGKLCTVRQEHIDRGMIASTSRLANGPSFADSAKEERDYTTLARPNTALPRIQADGLANARYDANPAKLVFVDCPTLLFGANEPCLLREGHTILVQIPTATSMASNPSFLRPETALFSKTGEPITVEAIKPSLTTTSDLRQNQSPSAAPSRNAAIPGTPATSFDL